MFTTESHVYMLVDKTLGKIHENPPQNRLPVQLLIGLHEDGDIFMNFD